MNQEKIGKFILDLRKEKNMTQNELADKLGITDRAISKWENGRGMPDLSLLMPLCEILGISINELLSGEKLNKQNYQEKLEENFINTIDYTDKKIKRIKKVFIIILSVILTIIAIIIILFTIDINRMKKNKQVLFSNFLFRNWGYSYIQPVNIQDSKIENTIRDYLIKKSDNEYNKYENEKTFISIKIYLIKEKNAQYNVYAWVLDGKYYIEDEEIKQDSGSSIPYKFIVEDRDGEFVVVDSKRPRDGNYYTSDMKLLFPSNVRNNMENIYMDGTIEKLQLDIEQQTKLYFHK